MQQTVVSRIRVAAIAALAMSALGACSMMGGSTMPKVTLSGAGEVPPVATAASGVCSLVIAPDGSVSGGITTAGIEAKAAHIHEGAPGVNGPVIVPLIKGADNSFAAPAGAKLTGPQYASYLAGNLYVNVHSAEHPGGEIRAQLTAK
jgi:hypothetical protein